MNNFVFQAINTNEGISHSLCMESSWSHREIKSKWRLKNVLKNCAMSWPRYCTFQQQIEAKPTHTNSWKLKINKYILNLTMFFHAGQYSSSEIAVLLSIIWAVGVEFVQCHQVAIYPWTEHKTKKVRNKENRSKVLECGIILFQLYWLITY